MKTVNNRISLRKTGRDYLQRGQITGYRLYLLTKVTAKSLKMS